MGYAAVSQLIEGCEAQDFRQRELAAKGPL
jgi:hypothetical protein